MKPETKVMRVFPGLTVEDIARRTEAVLPPRKGKTMLSTAAALERAAADIEASSQDTHTSEEVKRWLVNLAVYYRSIESGPRLVTAISTREGAARVAFDALESAGVNKSEMEDADLADAHHALKRYRERRNPPKPAPTSITINFPPGVKYNKAEVDRLLKDALKGCNRW